MQGGEGLGGGRHFTNWCAGLLVILLLAQPGGEVGTRAGNAALNLSFALVAPFFQGCTVCWCITASFGFVL